VPHGKVLCLADGEGRNGVFLAGLGYEVTSLDSSRVGLTKAARLAAVRGVPLRTLEADLNDYRIEPGAWDGIVSIFCHLPPSLRKRIHGEAVQGLKPGGVFLLEAYAPAQLAYGTGGPRSPDLLMPLEPVKDELAGLSFEIAREVVRDIREGRLHAGPSAVVQVQGVRAP
jgi:SAM-dependent methyltransferase